MLRSLLILTAVLLLANSSTAEVDYAREPALLAREVEIRGAAVVITELYDSTAWASTMAHIAGGMRKWLIAARALEESQGYSAAASEELYQNIGLALLNNPDGVLELLVSSENVQYICHGPFEAAGHPKVKNALAEVRAKIKRVESAGEALAAQRAACLKELRHSEQMLLRSNS
jgi:hypothetical protein